MKEQEMHELVTKVKPFFTICASFQKQCNTSAYVLRAFLSGPPTGGVKKVLWIQLNLGTFLFLTFRLFFVRAFEIRVAGRRHDIRVLRSCWLWTICVT